MCRGAQCDANTFDGERCVYGALTNDIRYHRRRMERLAKAKVVAVWGADFVQLLAALAVLPRSIWKKRLNSSYSSKSTEAK